MRFFNWFFGRATNDENTRLIQDDHNQQRSEQGSKVLQQGTSQSSFQGTDTNGALPGIKIETCCGCKTTSKCHKCDCSSKGCTNCASPCCDFKNQEPSTELISFKSSTNSEESSPTKKSTQSTRNKKKNALGSSTDSQGQSTSAQNQESSVSSSPVSDENKKNPDIDREKNLIFLRVLLPWIFLIAGGITAILLVIWAKLYFHDEENIVNLSLLLIIQIPSLITMSIVLAIICYRSMKTSQGDDYSEGNAGRQNHIRKVNDIRLAFLWFFVMGYICHCVIYLFKHLLNTCDEKEKALGITFNVIALLVAMLQFTFFLKSNVPRINNLSKFLVVILVSDASIWLDALLSESADIFTQAVITNNKTYLVNDLVKQTHGQNCTSNEEISNVVEKTDPFLNPLMIEFSLLAIQIISSRMFPPKEDSDDKKRSNENENNTSDNTSNHNRQEREPSNKHFIYFIASTFALGFIGFTLYVRFYDTTYLVRKFIAYALYQIVMKVIMILILGYIVVSMYKDYSPDKHLPKSLGISEYFLLISGFGNIFYSAVNIIPLFGISKFENISSISENLISILLALLQNITLLLQRLMHDKKNVLAWSTLAIFNFSLWLSDSIGESSIMSFTLLQYQHYTKTFWQIMTKLILPVTIFYRFHCGMEFLELWVIKGNSGKLRARVVQFDEKANTPC